MDAAGALPQPPVPDLERPAGDPEIWPLDPAVTFLNHGSFGSCPRPVLDFQSALRGRMERQPVQFLVRELEDSLDRARGELGAFLGAAPEGLAFVPNATAGVNAVLRSLRFEPGDEILVTDHEYQACRNAAEFAAGRGGAQVVVAEVPFPLGSEEEGVAAITGAATPRTRLALIDHVTSQTGLVLPIARIVTDLAGRGVDTLVDGAHAPGMVDLDIDAIGAAYYTGNFHKWVCAPKVAGFLHVREDRRGRVRPLVVSHGSGLDRPGRSRLHTEFDWPGTWDPSAALSVPEAIRALAAQVDGGWPGVRRRNRALARAARDLICAALGCPPPCPDTMLGSMAALPLPDAPDAGPPPSPLYDDPAQRRLLDEFGIEVPLVPWPAHPRRLLRISAQLYNSLPQYRALAGALGEVLG